MLGDSFLHIMPSVLGLHDHSHEEEDHGHDHDHDDHDHSEYYLVLGKMGVVLGSMYLFWIIESIMAMNGRSHGHSHGEECKNCS